MNPKYTKRLYTDIHIYKRRSAARGGVRTFVSVEEGSYIYYGPVSKAPVKAVTFYEFDLSVSLHGWATFFQTHLQALFELEGTPISIDKEKLFALLKDSDEACIHVVVSYKRKEMVVKMDSVELIFKKGKKGWTVHSRSQEGHTQDEAAIKHTFLINSEVLN